MRVVILLRFLRMQRMINLLAHRETRLTFLSLLRRMAYSRQHLNVKLM
jgi:hypothetical protein